MTTQHPTGSGRRFAGAPALSRTQIRAARRLLQRRGRDESGRFLVEGAQAVREALLHVPDAVQAVLVTDDARHEELLELARPDTVWLLEPGDAEALSDTVTSQGVFAIVDQLHHELADLGELNLVVVCAQVRDPGNAGTVIRCVDAFGADAVVMTRGSVEMFNPKTVRASVGSLFHLPVVAGVELDEAVAFLRGRGLQVLAADGDGQSLDEVAGRGALARPTAWIMGNEAWGLPEAERSMADQVVGVPMWGLAESLNLSTAAAVCLYATASAQRHGDPASGASVRSSETPR